VFFVDPSLCNVIWYVIDNKQVEECCVYYAWYGDKF